MRETTNKFPLKVHKSKLNMDNEALGSLKLWTGFLSTFHYDMDKRLRCLSRYSKLEGETFFQSFAFVECFKNQIAWVVGLDLLFAMNERRKSFLISLSRSEENKFP